MAFRLYIVPVVGTGARTDPRRPKYFADGQLPSDLAWSSMAYGQEPWMVVGADLATSQDNFVVGQADAFAIPFDLSTNLTAQQVTNVQNKLEAINVPANWVNTSMTWIQVVRIVLGMFLFMQRFNGLNQGVPLFSGGVTLGTQINQLTQTQRDNLTAAATSLGLSTAGITGTTTLRAALKNLADQMQTMQFNFNGTLL